MTIATFSLCSGCSADKRSRSEHKEEEQLALQYGREAALRLSPDSLLVVDRRRSLNDNELVLDTIELERILIDVKVRESTLRQRGEDKLADIYIETFLTTLDSVNPALRAQLQ